MDDGDSESPVMVLCVDDDPSLLEPVCRLLRDQHQFIVEVADSAQGALDRLSHGTFDLVLSDHEMPGMDGLALLGSLRSREDRIPFVLLIDEWNHELVRETLDMGADYCLDKGIYSNQRVMVLSQIIRQLVDVRRTALALRESEEKYQSFVRDFGGIAYKAMHGSYVPTLFDGKVEDITGYRSEDFTGGKVSWSKLIHPEDFELVDAKSEMLERIEGFVADAEYRIICKDGQVRWVRDIGRIVPGRAGSSEVLGVIFDITERKLLEERARERNDIFRLIAENAQDIVYRIVLRPELRFEYVSPAATAITGYSPEEHYADPLLGTKIVHPDDRWMIERFIRSPESQKAPLILRWLRKDGRMVWTEQRMTLIRGEDGEVTAVEGISRDITEQKMYQDALALANKKLKLLQSITRHDGLNQLSVIMAWLDLIRCAEDRESVVRASEAIAEAVETVKRYLEFSANYERVGAEEPVWVSAQDMVEKGLTGLQLSGIAVETELGGLELFVDPMVEKVFRNLAENSIRHGGVVRKIRLRFERSDPDGLLLYEDDGVGIRGEDKEKVFQQEYGKHTGYGLFLAREILSMTDMEIRETGEPGKGVRFEIHLPPGKYRLNR